jgi:hypothetical protein
MIMGRKSVLLEGILVGLVGATAVAIWFLLYDLAEGAPFRTPALLAAALFHGLRDAGALTVTPGLVIEYSLVHGLAFILFGLGASGLFALVDRDRRVLFAVFMLFCCFEVFALAMITALAAGVALPHPAPLDHHRRQPGGRPHHGRHPFPGS